MGRKKYNPVDIEDLSAKAYERNGRRYRMVPHYVRWSDFKDSVNYGKVFGYWDLLAKKGRQYDTLIGRITEYTPIKRIDSIIDRYEDPQHIEPFTLESEIYFTGWKYADSEDSNPIKMPYVVIPNEIVKAQNIRVDQPINITITNIDGITATESYHVSMMADYSLIVPLSRFKRLTIPLNQDGTIDDEKPLKYVFKRVYKYGIDLDTGLECAEYEERDYNESAPPSEASTGIWHPLSELGRNPNFKLFIKEGDVVRITIEDSDAVRSDYVQHTLDLIDSKKLMESIHREKEKQRRIRAAELEYEMELNGITIDHNDGDSD